MLTQLQNKGFFLSLSYIQQLRELAQILNVKLGGEIARQDFAAAMRTLQTFFALARAFEFHYTLIGPLVGLAIANIALQSVEEFIQQPGASNLFWALTDLPASSPNPCQAALSLRLFLNFPIAIPSQSSDDPHHNFIKNRDLEDDLS